MASIFLFTACSYDKVNLVEQPREQEFYEPFVNTGRDHKAAKSEMPTLKLLKISGLYEGRFALYDNGTFYYEINNLGNGTGDWVYSEGALRLKAGRIFLDLIFFVSAAEAKGTNTVVRFIDRNGPQKMDIQYQNMSACIQEQKDCSLGEFAPSEKGL
ncbi:MAG: transposase [Bdellovibrionaceae bacterium]|nr:transposase [Pseudobdellovibrionaceae bacterium]